MGVAEKLSKALGLKIRETLAVHGPILGVCNYPEQKILLKPGLSYREREHVIMHEVVHYTGVKELLDRFTLEAYSGQETFAIVEELIAETTALTILTLSEPTQDFSMIKGLINRAKELGVEVEEDVYPEVEKALAFLEPYIKEALDA